MLILLLPVTPEVSLPSVIRLTVESRVSDCWKKVNKNGRKANGLK